MNRSLLRRNLLEARNYIVVNLLLASRLVEHRSWKVVLLMTRNSVVALLLLILYVILICRVVKSILLWNKDLRLLVLARDKIGWLCCRELC